MAKTDKWTAEQDHILAYMRLIGHTAQEVAQHLSKAFGKPFTRCMVLGRIYRLKNRHSPINQPTTKKEI